MSETSEPVGFVAAKPKQALNFSALTWYPSHCDRMSLKRFGDCFTALIRAYAVLTMPGWPPALPGPPCPQQPTWRFPLGR